MCGIACVYRLFCWGRRVLCTFIGQERLHLTTLAREIVDRFRDSAPRADAKEPGAIGHLRRPGYSYPQEAGS
jgi:hypothetical protein